MPKDIDEDLIEATIRRVAESKAARADSPVGAPADDSGPVPDILRGHDEGALPVEAAPPAEAAPGLDEDAIEATIRRVAEAKAARDAIGEPQADASAGDDPAGDNAEDPANGEKSLEQLRFDDHGRSGPRRFSAGAGGGLVKSPWAQFRPTEYEDDVQPSVEPAPVEAPDELPAAAAVEQPAAVSDESSEIDDQETEAARPAPITRTEHAPLARFVPATITEPTAGDSPSLADISAKLDTVIALLERLSAGPARPSASDWAGAGRVVTLGGPPRPGLRDPRAATAEQLAPDQIDTRPLPPPPPPLHVEPKRGLELLPRTYRITVEDKRRGVDLVPLHRALLGMESVKDMSLLSYNNGVAIVALETSGDLEPDALRAAVSRAMARDAKVEVHNESTMVIKLAED